MMNRIKNKTLNSQSPKKEDLINHRPKLRELFAFFRFENGLIAVCSIFIFCLIAKTVPVFSKTFILLNLVTFLSLSAGNIINDIFDLEIDRINRPERLLPSGKIGLRRAWIIYVVCVLVAVLLSLYLNALALGLVVVNNIVLYCYSRYLKQRALWGNVAVAYLTASVFLLCGLQYKNLFVSFVLAGFAFGINFIRELIKDLEDAEGDKQLGLQTFAISQSLSVNKSLIYFLMVLFGLSVYLPFLLRFVQGNYVELMSVFIVLPLVYFAWRLKGAGSKKEFGDLSKGLKLLMFIGLIILYMVRNDFTQTW